jgi:hypothetical protein
MMKRPAAPVFRQGCHAPFFNSDVPCIGGGNVTFDQLAGVLGGVRLWHDVAAWQP